MKDRTTIGLICLALLFVSCSRKEQIRINNWILIKSTEPSKSIRINEIIDDSSLIMVNNKMIFKKDSIDHDLQKVNCADSIAFGKYFKINQLQFMVVRSRERVFNGEQICVYKILITNGDFNVDEANTFLYCSELGILIKQIKTGFREFEQYRLVNNDPVNRFTSSLVSDSVFFNPSPAIPED